MNGNFHDLWSPWQPTDEEPWDRRRAAHLLRRTGFGAVPAELDRQVALGFAGALDELFAAAGLAEFEEEMRPLERALTSSQDPRALAAWWLLRMVRTPCPFVEKMTLYWHGHFATSAAKVMDSRAMLAQNRLLREHALGRFEPMVQGISRDAAMLIYLDSTDNRKTRPNENYARELMELFCLGPGNYSEADIKQLARCFTGWEVRNGKFRFNASQHDHGQKSFLGNSGNFGGEEAVRVVLDQQAAAVFLAHKLVNWLVRDEWPPGYDIEPVATRLRETQFDIGATVRMILESRAFWAADACGAKVKSPVELAIGLVRLLGAELNMNELANRIERLGQLPLFPPNVKGWDGGRQWINASTFIGRVNLVREIVSRRGEGRANAALLGTGGENDLCRQIGQLAEWLVAVPLPDATLDQLVSVWNASGEQRRLDEVLCAMGALPEFHLN